MSNSWSQLPSAPRRGSSKTYNLTEADRQILTRAFQTVQTELTKLMGAEKAIHLVGAVKDGFNFETIDEGFFYQGTPYTILSMSHKGQSAGDKAWVSLEPHVAMRGVAFFTSVFFIQQAIGGSMIPNVSTWDKMQDGKVISVTRCHFTPNGRPLGVCRKEDRQQQKPNQTAGTAPASAWDMAPAPTTPQVF
tara:strand:- start:625 stop:1197 length:573 start_codon:yes stop_codon:yes gene_type:complete